MSESLQLLVDVLQCAVLLWLIWRGDAQEARHKALAQRHERLVDTVRIQNETNQTLIRVVERLNDEITK